MTTGAAAILGLILLAPMTGRIYERLTADDDGSAAIRLPLLKVAKEIIEDNPLVGTGLNNYRATMTRYDKTGISVSQIFPNPVHNVFAHVAAEVGIPGAILFYLLILTAALVNWRTIFGTDDRLIFALALAIIAGEFKFLLKAAPTFAGMIFFARGVNFGFAGGSVVPFALVVVTARGLVAANAARIDLYANAVGAAVCLTADVLACSLIRRGRRGSGANHRLFSDGGHRNRVSPFPRDRCR